MSKNATGLLTVDEFCEQYKLSRAMLYRLWKEGNGPSIVKIGGRRFIRPATAERWVQSQEGA